MKHEERELRNDRIAELYKRKRLTCAQVAQRMNMNTSAVARVVAARGLTRPNGWNAKPLEKNNVRNRKVIQLYTTGGLTTEQISEMMPELTPSGVVYVLKSRGVKLRKTGSWSPARPPEYYKIRKYAKSIAPHVGMGPESTTEAFAKESGIPAARLRAHLRALAAEGVTKRAARHSVLTFKQATAIKRVLIYGGQTFQQIADEYGIGTSTIWAIAMGKSWVDAPWPNGQVYQPKRAIAGKVRTDMSVSRDDPSLKNPDSPWGRKGKRKRKSARR